MHQTLLYEIISDCSRPYRASNLSDIYLFFACITFFRHISINMYSCERMSWLITQEFFQTNFSSFINHKSSFMFCPQLAPCSHLASAYCLPFTTAHPIPYIYRDRILIIYLKYLKNVCQNVYYTKLIHWYFFDISWVLLF